MREMFRKLIRNLTVKPINEAISRSIGSVIKFKEMESI